MSLQPRTHLRHVPDAVHGSVHDEELRTLGLRPLRDVIDFSVNTNPFGPAPAVVDAWRNADITRYPDPDARELRAALARRHGLVAEDVLVSNGSVELVWLAALGYLGPGDAALVVGPTFGEYERAVRIAGAEVTPWRSQPDNDFVLDIAAIDRLTDTPSVKAVFICNPNNPTGVLEPPNTIRDLASRHRDALFVVDEAYVPFVDAGASCLNGGLGDNLLVLRSMTKDCAIPGLRLGYAVAMPEIIRVLRVVQPTWSVGAPAQAAGLAALRCAGGFQAEGLALLTEAKRYLMSAIAELGLEVMPSAANFFLARVGDGAAFRRALMGEGCCVRDCASFGLPEYVRIAVRTVPECKKLVSAIARVLEVKRPGLARK